MTDADARNDGDERNELSAWIAELEAEAPELVLQHFDHDDAWRLGVLLVDLARERGAGVTIDIRRGRQQLFHYALPGTSPDNDAWARRKSRVVTHFGVSSYLVGLRLRLSGNTLAAHGLDERRHAAHGGSVPITVTGSGVIGAVMVSGLPQADDHRLVVEALRLTRPVTGAGVVHAAAATGRPGSGPAREPGTASRRWCGTGHGRPPDGTAPPTA